MKAVAVFPGSRQVKVVERDAPRLVQPDQVLLRMRDIGLCGTDKEICSFEYGTPPPGDDHLIIGHESVAEVVQAGRPSSASRPGIWWCRRSAARARILGAWPAVPGIRTSATPGTSASAASRKLTATWLSTSSSRSAT